MAEEELSPIERRRLRMNKWLEALHARGYRAVLRAWGLYYILPVILLSVATEYLFEMESSAIDWLLSIPLMLGMWLLGGYAFWLNIPRLVRWGKEAPIESPAESEASVILISGILLLFLPMWYWIEFFDANCINYDWTPFLAMAAIAGTVLSLWGLINMTKSRRQNPNWKKCGFIGRHLTALLWVLSVILLVFCWGGVVLVWDRAV